MGCKLFITTQPSNHIKFTSCTFTELRYVIATGLFPLTSTREKELRLVNELRLHMHPLKISRFF